MKFDYTDGPSVMRRMLLPAVFLTLHLRAGDVRAGEFLPPRMYEVTIETGMPHLEENLRYTTTHRRSCISSKELATEFPILKHPTLAGCSLGGESRRGDTVKFGLSCDAGHGTTGTAVWRIDNKQIRGRLEVKLGGKNMTFSQTVTAKAIGTCP